MIWGSVFGSDNSFIGEINSSTRFQFYHMSVVNICDANLSIATADF